MFSVIVFALQLIFSLLAKDYNPSDPNSIIFGESCAKTGLSSDLFMISKGIQMAFDEVNRLGGVLNGKMMNLSVKDDGYEPNNTVANTEQFLNSSDIFGLIGYVGTPTTSAVSDMIIEAEIPLIGSLTGATFLRSPFEKYFINIRSSYDDEATTMINYLIRKKYCLEISIVYQNDSFGQNAFKSLVRALSPYNIEVVSSATINRNSMEEIESAVQEIYKGQPGAIILAGTYKPVGKFIARYQKEITDYRVPTIFLVFSFVGTVSLAKTLEGHNTTLENTIVMEVVPNIVVEEDFKTGSPYAKFVENYLSSLPLGDSPTFHGLEGYLVGKLAIQMVQSTLGELTRENFLNSIYQRNQNYYIDGLLLGPYSSSSPTDACNQGLHSIFPVRLINSSYFESVSEAFFEWDGCFSEPTLSKPVLFLKQSAPMTGVDGNLGYEFSRGVRSALFSWNRHRSLEERIVGIVTKDDQYNSSLTRQNTEMYLANDSRHPTFGLVGYVGTPTFMTVKDLINQTRIPSIGFFTGSDHLREEGLENILNVRVGYFEEVITLAQYAFDMKFTRMSVFYMDGFESLEKVLEDVMNYAGTELISSVSYDHKRHEDLGDFDFHDEVSMLLEGEIPEVIILLGTAIPMSHFVKQVILELKSRNYYEDGEGMYFGSWSPIDPNSFLQDLESLGGIDVENDLNLFATVVVPFYMDESMQIVNEYRENMEILGFSHIIGFVSMEGFIAGRFVTEILGGYFTDEEIEVMKPDQLVDKVYDVGTIELNEITLGPYIRKSSDEGRFCNTGLREAWIVRYSHGSGFEVPTSMVFPYCSGPFSEREDFSSYIKKPIFFGLSNNLTDSRVHDFSFGIEEGVLNSFSKYQERDVDVNILFLEKDDFGDPVQQSKNLDWFEIKNVFSYVGFSSTQKFEEYYVDLENSPAAENDDDHYLISLSKSVLGGDPTNSRVLYFRPFLFDEVYYVSQYYKSIGQDHVVIIRGNDEFKMKEHFQQFLIDFVSGSNEEIVNKLNSLSSTATTTMNVIYLLDDINDLRYEIYPQLTDVESKFTFVLPSQFDRNEYSSFIKNKYHHVRFFSIESRLYQNFLEDFGSVVEYPDHAYYGFVVGKWISSNYIDAEGKKKSFFDNAFDGSITFQSELTIRFEKDCHVGVRSIILYENDNNDNKVLMENDFFETHRNDDRGLRCTSYKNMDPEFRDETDLSRYYWIFVPSMSIFFLGVVFNLLVCFFCCVCVWCCFGFLVWCVVITSVIVKQRMKLREFFQLEDFYVLLEEQKVRGRMSIKSSGRHLDEQFKIPYKDIKLLEIIGEGGSDATVYKIRWKENIVAFKCFKTRLLDGELNFDSFEKEASVMGTVSHPNIIQFFGMCVHPQGTRIGFIMEFCENGDISMYIDRSKINETPIPYNQKLKWLFEICGAMHYLHEHKRIIHRDLKCNNVLLNANLECKVMDFGISRFMQTTMQGNSYSLTGKIGTSVYMAPEIMSGKYSDKCDVFSFAIMSYIIITEKLRPYENLHDGQVQETDIEFRVASNPYFRPQFNITGDKRLCVEEWLKTLIITLWDHNPNKRKSFGEILEILRSKMEKIRKGKRSKMGTVVYIMKKGETENRSERFLMTEKTIEGVKKMAKMKWGDDLEMNRLLHGGKEIKDDGELQRMENDSLIQVEFSEESERSYFERMKDARNEPSTFLQTI